MAVSLSPKNENPSCTCGYAKFWHTNFGTQGCDECSCQNFVDACPKAAEPSAQPAGSEPRKLRAEIGLLNIPTVTRATGRTIPDLTKREHVCEYQGSIKPAAPASPLTAEQGKAMRAVLAQEQAIVICRELYDRFMMGGWEPQDAHTQCVRWLLDFAEQVGK